MNADKDKPVHDSATAPAEAPAKDRDKYSNDEENSGLTDDQRVSREADDETDGARVTLGPADEERLSK